MIERVKRLLAKPKDAAEWVRLVRAGARLYFWVTLASVVLLNVIGFSTVFLSFWDLPIRFIVGGRLLLAALAKILVIIAIFAMTLPTPGKLQAATGETLRRGLRPLVVTIFVMSLAQTALTFIEEYGTFGRVLTWLLWGLGIASNLGVFLFVGLLAGRFALSRLARSARIIGWCYLATGVFFLYLRYGWDSLSDWLSTGWAEQSALIGLSIASSFVGLALSIWGWIVVWRFGSRLLHAAEGRCVCCGYLLRELTGTVCPECGATFQEEQARAWQPECPRERWQFGMVIPKVDGVSGEQRDPPSCGDGSTSPDRA